MKYFIHFFCITFMSLSYAAPIEYFEQFFYKKEIIGGDPDFPVYRRRAVLLEFLSPKTEMKNGKFVKPLMSLALYPTSTFHMKYLEWHYETETSTTFYPGPCKIIRGTWKHEDGKLKLDQFLIAEEFFDENKNALKLTFTNAIFAEEIVGKPYTAHLGYIDRDPENDFCF